jgi:hypothetical protein
VDFSTDPLPNIAQIVPTPLDMCPKGMPYFYLFAASGGVCRFVSTGGMNMRFAHKALFVVAVGLGFVSAANTLLLIL